MNSETRNKTYTEVVNKYLDNDLVYDFKKIACKYENVVVNDPSKALEYVRLNLPRDLFDRFYAKVFPFEVCKYNDESVIKEKREKVIETAKLVANKKMCFLEAIEDLNMSYDEYIYLVKQLSVRYHALNMSTFLENKKHYDHVTLTINTGEDVGMMNKHEKEALISVMKKFNLPNNSETRSEAYKYAVNKELIKSSSR